MDIVVRQLTDMGFPEAAVREVVQRHPTANSEELINYLLNPPITPNPTPSAKLTLAPVASPPPHKEKDEHALDFKSSAPPLIIGGEKGRREKEEFEKVQREKAAREAAREREEKRRHLASVRAAVAEDKATRSDRIVKPEPTAAPAPAAPASSSAAATTGAQLLLQIRMEDGLNVRASFSSTDTVRALYDFVVAKSGGSVSASDLLLIQPAPRLELAYDDFADRTLQDAGIQNRASLLVQRAEKKGVVTKGDGVFYQPPAGARFPPGMPGMGMPGLGRRPPGMGMPPFGAPPGMYGGDDDSEEEEEGEDSQGQDMSYETLLERFPVITKGVAEEKLRSLPETAFVANPSSQSQESTRCTICLQDFASGDSVCTLPCSHFFHKRCIHAWLKTKNSCPFCNSRPFG